MNDPSTGYIGSENQLWHCEKDDVTVRVLSSDPYYPDGVICPECNRPMEYKPDRE